MDEISEVDDGNVTLIEDQKEIIIGVIIKN